MYSVSSRIEIVARVVDDTRSSKIKPEAGITRTSTAYPFVTSAVVIRTRAEEDEESHETVKVAMAPSTTVAVKALL